MTKGSFAWLILSIACLPPSVFTGKFKKRRQLFIGVRNETLSVVAMRVNNPDCSPVGINR
jgi:hypothetical protein